MENIFEQMLKGGHPNSLGRTLEVVKIIINDREKLSELFDRLVAVVQSNF